jgi:beta-glucanase (GH16 family)
MKFELSMLAVIGIAEANWQSGSIATNETFTYGKFVTRMQTPNKKGTVASFFTYWDGPGFYPGGWNEIDINVIASVEGVSTNVIYGDGHKKIEDHV